MFEASPKEFSCFSWNIEGFSSSKYSLKHFLSTCSPDFVFLSEPMLFQCDLELETSLFNGEYSSSLSSEDILNPDLPLLKRAKGGTMAMWKSNLDQFVSICGTSSSSFLPLIFSPPGLATTIHIVVYLPTAGQDVEFVEEIVKLNLCIQELLTKHPDADLYIRGDANVNPKDKNRKATFKKLCDDWNLTETSLSHPTYHHFVGNGLSDSQLDVILHTRTAPETLLKIFCKLEDPLVTSHHDALLSTFRANLDTTEALQVNPMAPRVDNNRVKIHWNPAGADAYKSCVSEALPRMRSTWLEPNSEASISILLQSTNAFLDKCARETNPHTPLARVSTKKSRKSPHYLVRSERNLLRTYKEMKRANVSGSDCTMLNSKHQEIKRRHHQLLRYSQIQERYSRDKILDELCSKDPSNAYRSLKKSRKTNETKIGKLTVGSMTYLGDTVPDGMYESIRKLKTEAEDTRTDSTHPDFSKEYRFILDICKSKRKFPQLSKDKSVKILKSIRKNVNDYYSITALHYLNAGEAGHDHFHYILNTIITNLNLAGTRELNTIYACILFKGHGKDKNSDRSYRTISTCPLVAKGLDIYVRELSLDDWNVQQAPTQFQGAGMSHELAALLLTETIQHSINVSKLPVFAIFLDAKSAFDRVLKEILVRNMFIAGTNDQRLVYLDQRLSNRKTYCEYDKQMMGPIFDTRGLEQGGVSSSDMYKLYNNEQATVAQYSSLGVPVRDIFVSDISLADDAVLLSNDIINLHHLLHLTVQYCNKYKVQLVPDKTKLVVFYKNEDAELVKYPKLMSPIVLDEQKIEFSDLAEHLGIVRSSSPGNMPNIVERLSAYKNKLFSVLPAGLALHHHANPAARLRVEQLYALPVLLSGLSALVLTPHETNIISTFHKNTLSRLMKLYDRTPDSAVYFLAGSLPGSALLHLRQLSVFGMICHLEGNILKTLALSILVEAKPSAKSWFQEIRDICIQYGLPHPISLIENPIKKEVFKKHCKLKILEYWHLKLSKDANLPSLQYLHPSFLSLSLPHPIWTSLDGNPYQAKAARIQSLFLTGRYRSERLCRFWSSNREGYCLLSPCKGEQFYEDIEHILLRCSGLTDERRRLSLFTSEYVSDKPVLKQIVEKYLYSTSEDDRMQFMVDCSVLPMVIAAYQVHGQIIHQQLFKIGRTWCRSLHVARLKALGRFNKL